MQLSEHFTLDEFTASEVASRKGVINVPPPEFIEHMIRLCTTILEPLRCEIKSPIVVTSGYRSIELNREVKGARNSYHTLGCAADIIAPGIPPYNLCKTVQAMKLPYDELILEFGAWTHVSCPVSPSLAPTRNEYSYWLSPTKSRRLASGITQEHPA